MPDSKDGTSMKRYGYWLMSVLLLLYVFFAGCASISATGKDMNTTKPEQEDKKENTGNINNIILSEFMLGVGDSIEVSVFRHEELKQAGRIVPSGKMIFPLIGDVVVAGKSISELRDDLRLRFSKYFVDPQIIINVTTIQSQKIIVAGEVNSPGVFNLDLSLSVTEAIFKAGGITNSAKSSNILLIRGKHGKADITLIDLNSIFKKGDFSQNMILQNGDVVYVPATTIANAGKFLSQLSQILGTIINVESGIVLWPQVRDAIKGNTQQIPLTVTPK